MDAEARPVRLLLRFRARVLALAALGGYFALIAVLGGRYRGWQRVGVPAARTRFGDLENLTSAWECVRRGIPVLPVNPCDSGRRPADFPQIWLLPSHLGLGTGDTFALGLAQGALFLLAALAVLPAEAGLATGALYALTLCSPAVMLGVERENPDLILFPIVLLAALAVSRAARGTFASGALLLVAGILKLYPIFALGLLVRRAGRAALLTAVSAALAFAIYGLASFGYLHRMLEAIPPSTMFAYGVRRIGIWFGIAAQTTVHTLRWYRVWELTLDLAGAATGGLLSLRLRRRLAPEGAGPEAKRDLDLFWAGACIYVGSYAVFSSNDYRLVFCLLTVPQLVRWTRARHPLGPATIALLVVTLWLDEWTGMPGVHVILDWWNRVTAVGSGAFPLPIVVLAQFGLFVCFAAWLLATAPDVLAWRLWRGRAPQRPGPR